MTLIFSKPVLMCDTREQAPLDFSKFAASFEHIIKATLKEGDYTAYKEGDSRKLAFERKSLVDLVGSITQGRKRFLSECERLQDYNYAAVIIETSLSSVMAPYSFSKANPDSVVGTLQMLQVRYDLDVIYSGSRSNSAEIIANKIVRYYA